MVDKEKVTNPSIEMIDKKALKEAYYNGWMLTRLFK